MKLTRMGALVVLAFSSGACGDDGDGGMDLTPTEPVELKVMTQNLYFGGDLTDLLEPECDGLGLFRCAAELYNTVQESDVGARMDAIAELIVAEGPDLIGLQEVSTFYVQDPGDQLPGGANEAADELAFDFLALLTASLSQRGLDYQVAARNVNVDVEIPTSEDNQDFVDVRLIDADVILAKAEIEVSQVNELNFMESASITAAGQSLDIIRGFSTLVATKEGKSFVVANSHLEVGGDFVEAQIAQAGELTEFLRELSGPKVVIGDFNSRRESADEAGDAYRLVTEDHLDVWTELRSGDSGETCCHEADLRNPTLAHTSRIDLVLYSESAEDDQGTSHVLVPMEVEVIGTDSLGGDSVLWPSDHSGVSATLMLESSTDVAAE